MTLLVRDLDTYLSLNMLLKKSIETEENDSTNADVIVEVLYSLGQTI